MKKILLGKSQFLASALSVLVCVFLVSAFVYAATTVGTNITTAGTITTTSYGQFNNVSTTDTIYSAGYTSSTGGFYTLGDVHVGADLTTDGNATTTGYLYAGGYASTTGGFYTLASAHIGVDATIDGNATTSGYVSVGTYLKIAPASTPTNPTTPGTCFIHTTSKHLKCYDGVAWLEAI